MTEKVIKRGYVKWTDENGVFHKEPLADHPELLAKASPRDQLAAEEARRLNAAAEVSDDNEEEKIEEVLEELKAAPDDVLTAAELDGDTFLPSDEPIVDDPLKELAEKTA